MGILTRRVNVSRLIHKFFTTVKHPGRFATPRGMLDHILQEYKVTHILALAAQAGVRYATKDPASYVASNVAGEMLGLGWGSPRC